LRPQEFSKVEDNSTIVLHYRNGVGIFEGSWDLPRSFQDLEVFGLGGSLHMKQGSVELRKGKAEAQQVSLNPLPPERSEPVTYMIHCLGSGKPLEGLVALDINVGVNEIIEAAKLSIKTGRAVKFPLSTSEQ
jgi:predicted dehydrogenase